MDLKLPVWDRIALVASTPALPPETAREILALADEVRALDERWRTLLRGSLDAITAALRAAQHLTELPPR